MDLEELERRTERLQKEVESLREDTRGRLHSLEMNHSISDVHHSNVERRLASIEDSQKWIVRLILGAIILALLGAVLQQGLP